ncbi:putative alkaline shock family protein YloU [Nocardia tenerifensis]|uniref:Putative alkaline shock family protein YloU n=1 Tax=Nocardia tenerifensis TaxID=228006 RepID=A0A318JV47_9NOCA|nr:Asp23/Gls24 family envelope stress response protein [Nocardia tenerifensis]PXX60891.1 putative alkaline shock family protein YloU [Nocardia tenerifensis]
MTADADSDAVSEVRIESPVVAAVAARAACATPGVVRLEPGVRGLVSSLVRAGKQRLVSADPAASEGVRVRRTASGALSVHVDVVISADRAASAVGHAVQQEVSRVVREQTGQAVAEVSVSILDIEPERP